MARHPTTLPNQVRGAQVLDTSPQGQERRARRAGRGPLIIAGAGLVVIAVIVGLYLFQPWKAFTTTTVSEAAPSAGGGQAPVAAGAFVSLAHETTGRAEVHRLPDGSAVLHLAGLATSDGPDVRVWLSSRTADRAGDADQGEWLELGPLKGNRGDQNYAVPDGTDLTRYVSVVLWCKRFSVAFGAAPLTT